KAFDGHDKRTVSIAVCQRQELLNLVGKRHQHTISIADSEGWGNRIERPKDKTVLLVEGQGLECTTCAIAHASGVCVRRAKGSQALVSERPYILCVVVVD